MDQAAVMIGSHPVGPKCARKAGLLELASKHKGVVRLFSGSLKQKRTKVDMGVTLDLFFGLEAVL